MSAVLSSEFLFFLLTAGCLSQPATIQYPCGSTQKDGMTPFHLFKLSICHIWTGQII